jgi:curved DNA-binding protein CbpA
MRTAYDILGLSPDADREAVRAAYRALAKTLHPDVSGGDASASQRFQEIQDAFEVLRDDARRVAYDESLEQRLHASRRRRGLAVAAVVCVVAPVLVLAALHYSGFALLSRPSRPVAVVKPDRVAAPASAEPRIEGTVRGSDAGIVMASQLIRSMIRARLLSGDDLLAIRDYLDRTQTVQERREGKARLLDLVDVTYDSGALYRLVVRDHGSEIAERALRRLKQLELTDGTRVASNGSRGALPAAAVTQRPEPVQKSVSPPVADVSAPPANPQIVATATEPTPSRTPSSGWSTHRDGTFGFSLDVPVDVVKPDVAADLPDTRHYASPDGAVRLKITAGPNPRGNTAAIHRRSLMQSAYAGADISYMPLRRNWLVLAGAFAANGPQAGRMFYERVTLACDGRVVHGWQITYPATERDRFRPIIERMHASYTHVRGSGPHCG